MKNISDRHRGNLDGRFTDACLPTRVTIALSPEVAANATAQHLTWMLVNLLARQTAEVSELELQIPADIIPVKNLSPLIDVTLKSFKEALLCGINQINPTLLIRGQTVVRSIFIRVGPGPLENADFSLATSATGWSGYVGQLPVNELGKELNPIGAYVAAALSASEVFKFVRGMRADAGSFANSLWFDAYKFQITNKVPNSPTLPMQIRLRPTVLAGVGAVANGFLHTLYTLGRVTGNLVMIDNDFEGITDNNLNRYVLFGLPHIASLHLKASTAAAMFDGSGISAYPIDISWQEWFAENSRNNLPIVISAVDKNSARHAIQDALPDLILGASTKDMRAQVNLYDVFRGGQCLRCRNRIETETSDEEIVRELRQFDFQELHRRARKHSVNIGDLESYLLNPQSNCGKIGGETLQKFHQQGNQVEWSVGFVSLLSGVLLAAEYLKLHLQSGLILTASKNTFRFQFWHPENQIVNRIVSTPPEEGCPCQSQFFRKFIKNSPTYRQPVNG